MNQLTLIILVTAVCGLAFGRVANDVREEKVAVEAARPQPKHTIDFDHFWTLSEIEHYMEDLVEDFPDLASIEEYGTTTEGRRVKAFVIRRGQPKRTIVIEAGLRPREWLATMAAVYIIHEIVEHDYEFGDILDNVDIVLIPVANPDGFVFTHTTDRNWNKNRRPTGPGCIGTDLNRNFQYQFHADGNPCSENHSGPFFFSEPETTSIRDILISYQDRVLMFLSLKGFGEQIAIPYNHFPSGTTSQAQLLNLGNQVAAAIRSSPAGRSYAVGVGGVLNGVEQGTPIDYTYELRRVIWSFEMCLPRGGSSGWDFPENQLQATLSETFTGFLVFANFAASS